MSTLKKTKILWAVRTRYLESCWNGDGKWHTHTTKWYDNSDDAWNEKEQWELELNKRITVYESKSSLLHK